MHSQSPWLRLVWVLAAGLAAGSSRFSAGAEQASGKDRPWPGADTPLAAAVENAALIVRAQAVDEAAI